MSDYIVGDIHGCFDKLQDVLEKVKFNPEKDVLYSTGDLCDRGTQNLKTLEYLYGLGKSFRSVFGNHDYWLYLYLSEIEENECWLEYNGGENTVEELMLLSCQEKKKYYDWVSNFPYMIRTGNTVICHNFILGRYLEHRIGDINPYLITCGNAYKYGLILSSDYDSLVYSRRIAECVLEREIGEDSLLTDEDFENEFDSECTYVMGHTPTPDGIHRFKNVYMIDTGAFITSELYDAEQDGCLTLMNLDSKEITQA